MKINYRLADVKDIDEITDIMLSKWKRITYISGMKFIQQEQIF